jgi:two-component system, NtrC family, sensor kinase
MTVMPNDDLADPWQIIAEFQRRLDECTAERDALRRELADAEDRQTATAEVLQVINSSPGDLAPVFQAIVEKAHSLCAAAYGSLQLWDGEKFRGVAMRGFAELMVERLRLGYSPWPNMPCRRLVEGESVAHCADLAEVDDPTARRGVALGGIRTILYVALRKDDILLGQIVAARQEVRPFSEKEIALVEGFAGQAVIAMENARLLDELRAARDSAETSLRDLKAAQANLIQAEKLASLGQLTAGVAHEIKNPLNFVNNFANLSVELLNELKAAVVPGIAALNDVRRAEIDETVETLTGNLAKIIEHGRRADGIVKSMLAHSRGTSGDRQHVDINALIEESLNLAYHGARAQNQSFNVTLERDFGQAISPIEVVPQDIARVFLNLFGNGFYAANKRRETAGNATFKPTLRVTTRERGGAIEIAVRDNGIGIAPENRDRLFQPFFTTKPTGEGTGLGLSISYDIVTQGHGGTIVVDSRVGEFTEFMIRLPRAGTADKVST